MGNRLPVSAWISQSRGHFLIFLRTENINELNCLPETTECLSHSEIRKGRECRCGFSTSEGRLLRVAQLCKKLELDFIIRFCRNISLIFPFFFSCAEFRPNDSRIEKHPATDCFLCCVILFNNNQSAHPFKNKSLQVKQSCLTCWIRPWVHTQKWNRLPTWKSFFILVWSLSNLSYAMRSL